MKEKLFGAALLLVILYFAGALLWESGAMWWESQENVTVVLSNTGPTLIEVTSSAPNVPRPYLTREVEESMARDNCTITHQRCRADNICETCVACPHEGRMIRGWVATKCKSTTDCVLLETNKDWEHEKTDPGWCEEVQSAGAGP